MGHLEKLKEEWFELGRKYHENEEYEKAVSAYRHVVKIDKCNFFRMEKFGVGS